MGILNVGRSYSAKVNVTNRSSRGRQLVADTLLVEAQATLSGQVIQGSYGPASILAQIDFGPGETQLVRLNFDIGWGDGDKQGQVKAAVKVPDGTLLKDATLDFYVQPRVNITFAFNSSAQSVSWIGGIPAVLQFSITRQNVGSEQATLWALNYTLEQNGAIIARKPLASGSDVYMSPGQAVTDTFGFDMSGLPSGSYDIRANAVDRYLGYVGEALFSGVVFVGSAAPKIVWEMPLRAGDNTFMYDGPTGVASTLMASILPYLIIAYYYTDPAKGWQQVVGDTILQRTEVVSTYVGYQMTLFVKVSQDVLWSITA